MQIKPIVSKLMKRDALGFGLITLIIVVFFLGLQIVVTLADPDVNAEIFVRSVWPWVIGFITLMWVIWPWIAYLWYLNLAYDIGEERITIFKGILNKKEVSVPYYAVTDFTLRRGWFERMLGIGAILVQTAGQSNQAGVPEAKLEGLEHYAELHQQLRGRIHSRRSTQPESLGQAPETPFSSEQILAATLGEIRKIRELLEKR